MLRNTWRTLHLHNHVHAPGAFHPEIVRVTFSDAAIKRIVKNGVKPSKKNGYDAALQKAKASLQEYFSLDLSISDKNELVVGFPREKSMANVSDKKAPIVMQMPMHQQKLYKLCGIGGVPVTRLGDVPFLVQCMATKAFSHPKKESFLAVTELENHTNNAAEKGDLLSPVTDFTVAMPLPLEGAVEKPLTSEAAKAERFAMYRMLLLGEKRVSQANIDIPAKPRSSADLEAQAKAAAEHERQASLLSYATSGAYSEDLSKKLVFDKADAIVSQCRPQLFWLRLYRASTATPWPLLPHNPTNTTIVSPASLAAANLRKIPAAAPLLDMLESDALRKVVPATASSALSAASAAVFPIDGLRALHALLGATRTPILDTNRNLQELVEKLKNTLSVVDLNNRDQIPLFAAEVPGSRSSNNLQTEICVHFSPLMATTLAAACSVLSGETGERRHIVKDIIPARQSMHFNAWPFKKNPANFIPKFSINVSNKDGSFDVKTVTRADSNAQPLTPHTSQPSRLLTLGDGVDCDPTAVLGIETTQPEVQMVGSNIINSGDFTAPLRSCLQKSHSVKIRLSMKEPPNALSDSVRSGLSATLCGVPKNIFDILGLTQVGESESVTKHKFPHVQFQTSRAVSDSKVAVVTLELFRVDDKTSWKILLNQETMRIVQLPQEVDPSGRLHAALGGGWNREKGTFFRPPLASLKVIGVSETSERTAAAITSRLRSSSTQVELRCELEIIADPQQLMITNVVMDHTQTFNLGGETSIQALIRDKKPLYFTEKLMQYAASNSKGLGEKGVDGSVFGGPNRADATATTETEERTSPSRAVVKDMDSEKAIEDWLAEKFGPKATRETTPLFTSGDELNRLSQLMRHEITRSVQTKPDPPRATHSKAELEQKKKEAAEKKAQAEKQKLINIAASPPSMEITRWSTLALDDEVYSPSFIEQLEDLDDPHQAFNHLVKKIHPPMVTIQFSRTSTQIPWPMQFKNGKLRIVGPTLFQGSDKNEITQLFEHQKKVQEGEKKTVENLLKDHSHHSHPIVKVAALSDKVRRETFLDSVLPNQSTFFSEARPNNQVMSATFKMIPDVESFRSGLVAFTDVRPQGFALLHLSRPTPQASWGLDITRLEKKLVLKKITKEVSSLLSKEDKQLVEKYSVRVLAVENNFNPAHFVHELTGTGKQQVVMHVVFSVKVPGLELK